VKCEVKLGKVPSHLESHVCVLHWQYFPVQRVHLPSVLPGSFVQFGDFELDCGRFELLRSGQFVRVERKPMELLVLLVARGGAIVTRAEIAERLWSSEVFVDTEHGINTAVRKLRYVLRDDPDRPRFIQTVTGMGYRFVAHITVIEPPVLAEPCPAEQPPIAIPNPEPATTESAAQSLPKKFPAVQIGVAALIALIPAFILLSISPHKVAGLLHRDINRPIASLAVIPLENLSGDPNQEYFADGMTDELITMLAKNSTLRITSRTSVMQYKGARRPLREIARTLNVDAILEGSISRTNGMVHMNLQLIGADADAHLWADSYDRSAEDAVTLPNEATRAIAERLHSVSAVPAAPARTIRPDAHDAYLRGQYFWYAGQNRDAIREFDQAIAFQPDYAAAWAGVADSYLVGTAASEIDPVQALPEEEAAAKKALELDPLLPEAHLAIGEFLAISRWEWERGDREILRAIELNPQFTQAVHFQAMMLATMNQPLEGVAMQKRASAIDPIARPWALPRAFLWARDYDAALNDALTKSKADPNIDGLNLVIYRTYQARGNQKEAGIYLMKFLKLTRDEKAIAAFERAFERSGYRGVVKMELEESERDARARYVSPFNQATLSGELGDRDKALTYLEQAFRIHDVNLYTLTCDPEFDFIRGEPRFQAIVKAMGLEIRK
jgi:TolB-like protein/DNA-binding winged helix-turn-helix (wHTH) protein